MRWRGRERSDNVEDHRGVSPKMAMGGGGGIMVIIVIVVMKMMGASPEVQQAAVQVAQTMQNRQQAAPAESGAGVDDEHAEFIAVITRDTETVWTKIFNEEVRGMDYKMPVVRIFEGQTQTGCGMGNAAMGPFYCPADQKIYIPPSFFDDLARRHKAPGDFAQAYVIAHEVAHHVQNLLQLNRRVNEARRSGDERLSNQESVRLELQADYLAGVWAYHAQRDYRILEPGDMEEAIQAANQIGDDTLGHKPERYTHGTSAQRVRWFRKGMSGGSLKDCELLFQLPYSRL